MKIAQFKQNHIIANWFWEFSTVPFSTREVFRRGLPQELGHEEGL